MRASALGGLRSDIEAAITYEGDNNVLPQQTQNWLLRQWKNFETNQPIENPWNTIDFMSNASTILKRTFHYTNLDQIVNPDCKYLS